MNFYISYFYQIRNFKPHMIPISTAVSDPKWYHKAGDQNSTFKDNNGVLNGLRCYPLAPGRECSNLCKGAKNCKDVNPSTCQFLSKYGEQLNRLNFTEFMYNLEEHLRTVADYMNIQYCELIPVFIVYETPDNPCSERVELVKWFADNGVSLSELEYPIKNFY